MREVAHTIRSSCSSWAFATQMIAWRDAFCDGLAVHGLVRFDNGDVGLSSKFEDAPSSVRLWVA